MIYIDPVRMRARNLVPMDVVKALKRGNLMTSSGTAYSWTEPTAPG
jgi:multidrug efflux pump subunit AcrB